MTCFNPFLFLVFFKWLKKREKYLLSLVLEPAISDDGSYHSWELLTKDIIAPAQKYHLCVDVFFLHAYRTR